MEATKRGGVYEPGKLVPLDEFGINPQARRRALYALEEAGLIRVERPPGCSLIVTITEERE